MRHQQREALVGLLFVFTVLLGFFLLIALLTSCRSPDRFDIGYGHQFQDPGSVKELGLDTGDADTIYFSVGWNLRPMQVEVVERPAHNWLPYWDPAQSRSEAQVMSEEPDRIAAAAETFDTMGWVSKLVLLVMVCWLGWVYREKIGNLIGRGKS